jgi:hypothetical protein
MHGYGLTGDANLTGYYFNPNFLNFQFRPYYDRSQVSSDSQVVTRGTGFGGSVGLFGGSHFPGSISFGKDFSANNEFRVAGVPDLVGDSSGQNLAISWSELVPNLPRVTASYAIGSNTASIAGLAPSRSSARNLNVNSGYEIWGFSLQGNLSHNDTTFTAPQYLSAESFSSGGSGNGYSVTAQHALPLRGNISLGWNHTNFASDAGTEWNSTSYNASNSISPTNRLTLYQFATYTTNLSAAFIQSLGGVGTPFVQHDLGLSGFLYGAGTSYHVTHRVQWLPGQRYEDSQYGANLNYNYSHRLFGLLYFGIGVVDTASKVGNDGTGLNANVGMSRKFGRWDTSADFNYTHFLQTIITIAQTSSYNYGASVRRRLNQDTSFGGSIRFSHSGLVTQEGSGNSAVSAGGSFGWRKYHFSGSYSQSDGTAILNSEGGLTPTPVGLIGEDLMLFNARSWSASASTRLFRAMSVTGSYSQFNSSITQTGAGSFNSGTRYNIRSEYRLRKFAFLSGFSRSSQEVSFVPGGPRVINSYYLSISRWFKAF